MSASEFDDFMQKWHQAMDAFVKGDPEPEMRLYSKGDDATLANPFGPPLRGWKDVSAALQRAASQLREGEPVVCEVISQYSAGDLAYVHEIERTRLKIGGSDAMAPMVLRATNVFRREKDGWRVVHRHADPISTPRPAETLAQK